MFFTHCELEAQSEVGFPQRRTNRVHTFRPFYLW